MDNKLLVDVVMLPGDGPLYKQKDGTLVVRQMWHGPSQYQHLYLVSSREIKKGDWSYSKLHAQITNWGKYKVPADSVRIEATTDPSLGLPLIPTKWIEEVYVPSQGKIKQIFLKSTTLLNTALKISGFSEVIILSVKENWNREEVKDIFLSYSAYCADFIPPYDDMLPFDEWFDKKY